MKIIYKDGTVAECPQEEELHVLRHTAAHIMAQAIKRLYPQADFAFGPATENGFYYDVDLGDTKLTDDGLTVRVTLRQGVYHQIKRMFGVYDAGVNALHRESIGGVALDAALAPGQWRELTEEEEKKLRQKV